MTRLTPLSFPLATLAPADAAGGGGEAHVLEIVDFRLVKGAEPDAFLEAAKETEALLSARPEFLRRMLVPGPDGIWTDVIEWTSREAAERAANEVMAAPGFAAFGAMIDSASVAIRHAPILWRMG